MPENLFRNIRDRVGKARLNRIEKAIVEGVELNVDRIDGDISDAETRLDTLENSLTRLSDLTIEAGADLLVLSPEFSPEIVYYQTTIPHADTTITITATAEGTAVTTDGGEKINLVVGVNAFTLNVTSNEKPNGVYKIVVTREAADTSAYDAIVAEVAALIEADYTAESWGLYETAIGLTDLTLDASDDQAALDAEVIDIQAALDLLAPV